ncbi:hypothetical protein [Stenotrophomonas pavanii]|uniref:hypothetical protein n=1 Tax=Stenotrophomonas pavanii TaxID=487698 RepID=UPI003896B601
MSQTKHTPGPWVIEKLSGGWGVRAPNWGYVAIHNTSDLPHWNEGQEANRRLIAAAPDLLGALSRAVRETEQFLFEAWLVRECPSGDVDAVQRQWLESSDRLDFIEEWAEQIDAIAKATGERA